MNSDLSYLVHALMVEMHVATCDVFAWRLANATICAVLCWRVGFPRATPGSRLSRRQAIARTLVASMAGGISASIILGVYAGPFEVVLNLVYTLAACLRGGEISVLDSQSPADPAPRSST